MYKYKTKDQIEAYKHDMFSIFLKVEELMILRSLFFSHKDKFKKEYKTTYYQLIKKYTKPIKKSKKLISHTLHQLYVLLHFLGHFVYMPDEDEDIRKLYDRLLKVYQEKDKLILESIN